MLVLGISGGGEFPYEDKIMTGWTGEIHDAAAVLLDNGKIVAAIEEERISRIKHNGKAPVNAIKFCLNSYGVSISDIDRIVYYCREDAADLDVANQYILYDRINVSNAKDWLKQIIYRIYGFDYPQDRIHFVDHHICHAASAYYMSGFEKSLIVTIDGASPEGIAGYVISTEGESFEILDKILNEDSLGSYYLAIIKILGYFIHDEYKVMGLAPYGDPEKYRKIFKKTYTLLPEGKFKINSPYCDMFLSYIKPRKKGGVFTQDHKDIAAILQESLEEIVLHILKYYRKKTGHKKLCLAGGVAHNSSMNGKILYSGLFDEVFVQPAAHDAGNALGGALYVSKKLNYEIEIRGLQHLYFGTDIKNNNGLRSILERWDNFIEFSLKEDIIKETANLLEKGYVIGWVQGRSEFGPRALGNRSILADPRPSKNKTIINSMVKKREGYRPFAPSVLEEYLDEYYVIPESKAPFSYMNFVIQTKEGKKKTLGAVTHIDGSARIQTVSRTTNEKYWRLIDYFRELTGIPILLNTSFNNNYEPIVDSEEDAIVCFLTTNINCLVMGDYLITKKNIDNSDYLTMFLKRPINTELKKLISYTDTKKKSVEYEVRLLFGNKYKTKISENLFKLLELCDGKKTLDNLFDELNIKEIEEVSLMDEIQNLWFRRLLILSPVECL